MQYTLDEVSKHNTKDSLWVVMNNNVYDLTSFLEQHPGGEKPLLKYAGTDVTEKFASVKAHSNIKDLSGFLDKCKVGALKVEL